MRKSKDGRKLVSKKGKGKAVGGSLKWTTLHLHMIFNKRALAYESHLLNEWRRYCSLVSDGMWERRCTSSRKVKATSMWTHVILETKFAAESIDVGVAAGTAPIWSLFCGLVK
jgi:hypothetical protein